MTDFAQTVRDSVTACCAHLDSAGVAPSHYEHYEMLRRAFLTGYYATMGVSDEIGKKTEIIRQEVRDKKRQIENLKHQLTMVSAQLEHAENELDTLTTVLDLSVKATPTDIRHGAPD